MNKKSNKDRIPLFLSEKAKGASSLGSDGSHFITAEVNSCLQDLRPRVPALDDSERRASVY